MSDSIRISIPCHLDARGALVVDGPPQRTRGSAASVGAAFVEEAAALGWVWSALGGAEGVSVGEGA